MTTSTTYATVAERTGITIPDHLIAQAEVPVAVTGWRQGDVFARRETHTPAGEGVPITGRGVQVVRGEADRNSHILNGDGLWYPGRYRTDLDYGLLVVPEGGLAVLTHTAEHGSIGFAAGCWRLWGQLDAATMRRAAD